MAKGIVTPELVADAAALLLQEGIEPSIINVQGRIGAGSYTTIKRFLDDWRKQQAERVLTVELPPELANHGADLTRTLWRVAQQQAAREIQLVKEQSAATMEAAQREVAGAVEELHRLERIEADQSQSLEQAAARIKELELRLAALAVEASRAAVLEKEVQRLQTDTAEARTEIQRWKQQVEQRPSLESVMTDLRTQVEALTKRK